MPDVKTPYAFEHATSSTSGSKGSPREGRSVLAIEGDLHEMKDAIYWPPRVVLCVKVTRTPREDRYLQVSEFSLSESSLSVTSGLLAVWSL